MTIRDEIRQVRDEYMAEVFTGCLGAGDYARWAEVQGYPHCRVLDWTSSAGDWSFIVSQDGETWYPMYQENNGFWEPGFTRTIDTERPFWGTAEDALAFFSEY